MTYQLAKYSIGFLKLKIILSLATLNIQCSSSNETSKSVDKNVKSIDIKKELDVEENLFNVSLSTDTIIFGKKGTAIFIGSNSFETDDGKSIEKVDLVLKEYYDISEIIIQNLSTESEEGLLETGGMIHIEAASEGKKAYLKPNKDLIIHFPKNGNTEKMQLFSQSFSDSNSDIIKWKEEKSASGYEIDTITPFIIKYQDLDDDIMELANGTNIWDWIKSEIVLTNDERDYVRLRDVSIKFSVLKNGDVTNVNLEKKYDKKRCKRLMKIIENIPKIRPFKRNGKEIDMESWVNFAVKSIPPKYLSNKDYLNEIENKYLNFNSKSINEIDQLDLNYYIFTTTKLGWLNCDRFINDPSPKVDMSLNLKDPENLMIKFVYKDFKSIITPNFENGINYFKGLPEGKNITLIIIKSQKNKIQMSITEHLTANGEIKGISFKDYTMEELKKELYKLN